MTSFAFILGVVPLVLATGAGASARKSIGIAVFTGMLASTCLAVLFVPSFFVVVQRFENWRKATQGQGGRAAGRRRKRRARRRSPRAPTYPRHPRAKASPLSRERGVLKRPSRRGRRLGAICAAKPGPWITSRRAQGAHLSMTEPRAFAPTPSPCACRGSRRRAAAISACGMFSMPSMTSSCTFQFAGGDPGLQVGERERRAGPCSPSR